MMRRSHGWLGHPAPTTGISDYSIRYVMRAGDWERTFNFIVSAFSREDAQAEADRMAEEHRTRLNESTGCTWEIRS